jgi:hypothetical protein
MKRVARKNVYDAEGIKDKITRPGIFHKIYLKRSFLHDMDELPDEESLILV